MHSSDQSFQSCSSEDKTIYEYYFDSQTFVKMSSIIDEAALARVLTKLAVGTATVWWSIVEIKEMVSLCRRTRKNQSL